MNARAAYCRDYYVRYERAIRGNRPLAPARPVANHIAACIELGMSRNAIARTAGVSESTVRRIESMPDASVREGVAHRILGVPAQRPVTAQGVVRRLRALAAMGWSNAVIATESGLNVDTIKAWRRGEFSDPSIVADRVAAVYDALSMRTPKPVGRFERGAVSQVRARAARNHWPSPLAWDDIDDPDALPDLGDDAPPDVDLVLVDRVINGTSSETTAADRDAIIPRLAATGMGDAEIAALCRVSDRTVLRTRQRLGVPSLYAAVTYDRRKAS